MFSFGGNLNVNCMVDASHNCYADGKAHYGFLFYVGDFNAPFCVKSTKIKIVTMSSTESEYIALAYAVKEAIYIIRLLKDLGFFNGVPVRFYEDNLPVINMLQADQLNHETTKHINNRYHFIRDLFKIGFLHIVKIDTKDNIADILTKPLDKSQFNFLAPQLLNCYE